jgi:hypothetical protein
MHSVCLLLLGLLPLLEAAKFNSFDDVRSSWSNLRQNDDPGSQWKINCKEISFSEPRWYLYDPSFVVYNYLTGLSHGDIGFGASNAATGSQFECFVKDINLAPAAGEGKWYNCSIPGAQFRFNLTSNVVELKQSWVCDNAPTQVASSSFSTPLRRFESFNLLFWALLAVLILLQAYVQREWNCRRTLGYWLQRPGYQPGQGEVVLIRKRGNQSEADLPVDNSTTDSVAALVAL